VPTSAALRSAEVALYPSGTATRRDAGLAAMPTGRDTPLPFPLSTERRGSLAAIIAQLLSTYLPHLI
jgi:hypothetical protein